MLMIGLLVGIALGWLLCWLWTRWQSRPEKRIDRGPSKLT